jgi:hypothetical protein
MFACDVSGVVAGVSDCLLFSYLLFSEIIYLATCFAFAG